MAKSSLARPARTYTPEERARMHGILKESEERYRFELLDQDEREILWNRVVTLKKKLAASA
jgi:hypothetical protein